MCFGIATPFSVVILPRLCLLLSDSMHIPGDYIFHLSKGRYVPIFLHFFAKPYTQGLVW